MTEICLKLYPSEGKFWIILIRQKWGFNLIQIQTKTKTSTATVFSPCKNFICAKFTVQKTQTFKKKIFRQSFWKIIGKIGQVNKNP